MPGGISFAIPSARGGFIVGLRDRGLCRFQPGDNSLVPLDIALPAGQQTNDATVDASGRLLFGTRATDRQAFDGKLVIADAAGSRVVDEGFGLINGLAVDALGGRLWIADTHDDVQAVWTCSYDLATGTLGTRQQVFDFRHRAGRPDGAAVDAAGNLWLAEIGGSCLVHISPAGSLLQQVNLPISMPTKPCFDAWGRLLVTTASRDISLTLEPAAGHLLALSVPDATVTALAAV